MIELCFGTAMKGCLRYAARPDGFVTSLADILCINWDFSLGDISAVPEKVWEDVNRLKARVQSGEPIRLWDNNTPFTRCGLLFAADLLGEAPCHLFAVSLPREPVVAAQLIVDAMVRQNIPHGEGFIAWRIRTLIDNKELRLVEEHPTMFSRSIITPME